MTKAELLTLWDEWFDGAVMDETMVEFLRAVVYRERARCQRIVEDRWMVGGACEIQKVIDMIRAEGP